MSTDRFFNKSDWQQDNIPRCRRNHFESYVGKLRDPCYIDERGCVQVVDLVFGGRVGFIPDPEYDSGSKKSWYKVKSFAARGK